MDTMEMQQRMDTPPPVITTSYPIQQQVHITVGQNMNTVNVNVVSIGQPMTKVENCVVDNSDHQQNHQTHHTNDCSESKSHHHHHSSSKKDKKREAIDAQAREVIYKVIKFFESEKRNRGYAYPVENVMKRASAATGLSESTIKRIKRDGLKAEANNTKMSGPKKKRVRRTKVQLDYYQLCALRGIVNGYTNRKEVPTLSKILNTARIELNYKGGKESLRLILLNKLGIKFKKCEKKNKIKEEQQQMVNNVQTMHQQAPPPPTIHTNMQMHHAPPTLHNTMMHHQLPDLKHHQLSEMKAQTQEHEHCVYSSVLPTLIGL
ncbi:uncharacterized protein LOC125489187 [Plutella xylostella]|uniref:uncharacterized protein LOC125489187 n=1 Tax=Plutella xylostella TaxID=51655 RepID=UPI0020325BC2|nr:uncharacterized protein LOC125489187 [Plutella xylostella]